jgi:hypothetical protein
MNQPPHHSFDIASIHHHDLVVMTKSSSSFILRHETKVTTSDDVDLLLSLSSSSSSSSPTTLKSTTKQQNEIHYLMIPPVPISNTITTSDQVTVVPLTKSMSQSRFLTPGCNPPIRPSRRGSLSTTTTTNTIITPTTNIQSCLPIIDRDDVKILVVQPDEDDRNEEHDLIVMDDTINDHGQEVEVLEELPPIRRISIESYPSDLPPKYPSRRYDFDDKCSDDEISFTSTSIISLNDLQDSNESLVVASLSPIKDHMQEELRLQKLQCERQQKYVTQPSSTLELRTTTTDTNTNTIIVSPSTPITRKQHQQQQRRRSHSCTILSIMSSPATGVAVTKLKKKTRLDHDDSREVSSNVLINWIGKEIIVPNGCCGSHTESS